MNDKTYGVLIVGAGWVSTQHVAAYVNNPHARVVAVCDRSLDKARQRVDQAGLADVAVYENIETALGHPGVDIACLICTPQHVHCRHASWRRRGRQNT